MASDFSFGNLDEDFRLLEMLGGDELVTTFSYLEASETVDAILRGGLTTSSVVYNPDTLDPEEVANLRGVRYSTLLDAVLDLAGRGILAISKIVALEEDDRNGLPLGRVFTITIPSNTDLAYTEVTADEDDE